MAATENFRSALHGFNRNDVVQFIQKQRADFEKELRMSREENNRLKETLRITRTELDACHMEKAALMTEITALREAAAAPKAPEVPVVVADIPTAPVAAPAVQEAPAAVPAATESPAIPVVAVPSNFNEQELAAYRRAERTERLAQERAESNAERMREIFQKASGDLDASAQDLSVLFSALRNNFDQLQEALDGAKAIVGSSSDSLKAVDALAQNN